ncbi:hypothetical protein IDM40_09260 [Nocardiopsis sp. HNM0947]|uniref:Protein kinase domain-containing protein n=1 Tax=Nocardiopsis coralli TaxID=2772213 RepID=A0ABR9P4Y8_9ACTN|nr:protein kinase family protein [Nocardiopsis coralli]MBE2998892.1 hypothetical protein [Nocardiopsis coralli]
MHPLHPHDPPRVGPYRPRARLGEDAFSRVYLATAPDRPPVALKVARSGLSSDPSFRPALTDLVAATRPLRSPYVAGVLDADTEGPAPWVAVTRPFGPSLAECVHTHGPLPAAALAPLALATAQGLADLHAAGHPHGALWPDGVLLTEHGAVLADPGFERIAADLQQRAPHPAFAAPEGGSSQATDVFAWAATLCFAASGVEGPGGLERVPMQLRGLVDACLQQGADLRPTAADLVRILGGPTAPGPWPEGLAAVVRGSAQDGQQALAAEAVPEKKRGRGKAVALTAAGLAVVLLAGSGAVWALNGNGDGDGDEGGGTTEEEAEGLITDTGCLEADDLPEPDSPISDLDAVNVSFSPDGNALLISSFEHGYSVWDWREGTEIARVDGELGDIHGGEFAPVGCMVAGTHPTPFDADDYDRPVVHTHDLPSGESQEQLGPQSERVVDELEPPRRAEDYAFSPSGEQMAVAVDFDMNMGDGEQLPPVGIVDMATGEIEHEWTDDDALVSDVEYLDEDRIVAATAGPLELRDAETGEVLDSLRDHTSYEFTTVPGTAQVLYRSDEHMVLWDFDEGDEVDRFPVPDYHESYTEEYGYPTGMTADPELGVVHFSWGEATSAAVDTSGREYDHHGHLWDLESGEDLIEDEDGLMPRPVAFHPAQEVIASVNAEGDVDLLDPQSHEVTATLS